MGLALNILPEDDGSYTAICERHLMWRFNGADARRHEEGIDPKLLLRLGSEERAVSALRRHVALWQCSDPDTLEAAISKMRQKPGVQVVP